LVGFLLLFTFLNTVYSPLMNVLNLAMFSTLLMITFFEIVWPVLNVFVDGVLISSSSGITFHARLRSQLRLPSVSHGARTFIARMNTWGYS
jgi:hypothetical protein